MATPYDFTAPEIESAPAARRPYDFYPITETENEVPIDLDDED